MASQGPLSPGTLADDATIGTSAWSSPGNAAVSDNTYATAIITGGAPSHYLKATNFGFTIPAGATINGIVLEVEQKASATGLNGIKDGPTILVKGGTISGNDNARVGTQWTTSDSYITYGSSSDLWGLAWTDSDINALTFGAVASSVNASGAGATASIDHMRITVYYTPSAGGVNIQTMIL